MCVDLFHGVLLFLLLILPNSHADVYLGDRGGRIRGEDEPQLVSYRVLEGVTEPFEALRPDGDIPTWKLMKAAADAKAASRLALPALQEYGQILKNPYIFGEMPSEERYDVFLSMSKLLKGLGFLQKAEQLLVEALASSQEPHEALLQLGLLLLDQEDLSQAKVHFKNCLYYRESDVVIMVHLTTILVAEGRLHEAQFYLTRVLMTLEQRIQRLSKLVGRVEVSRLGSGAVAVGELTAWLEDVFVKVLHGEFRLVPSQYPDFFRYSSQLYDWLSDGELVGRFLFDLGQSLYEGGRPVVGRLMMRRGVETSDESSEGAVSLAIVRTRTALDFPVIASSMSEIVEAHVAADRYLHVATQQTPIDIENSVDIYWSIPLIALAGLPAAQLSLRVFDLFGGMEPRRDWHSQVWATDANVAFPKPSTHGGGLFGSFFSSARDESDAAVGTVMSKTSADGRTSVGVLGGHMNNHAVGLLVLHRLLGLDPTKFHITLIALPLIADAVTTQIASMVHEIVNIPMDLKEAHRALAHLHLDIVLFPDYQPFPDQHAMFFRASRLAPVQVCVYVQGGGCSSPYIDYYFMPTDAVPVSQPHVPIPEYTGHDLQEQVVWVDWPVITSTAVREVAEAVRRESGSIGDRRLKRKSAASREEEATAREVEGNIFFEGQPIALLCSDPSLVHPSMDDALLKLLHSIPNLQLLLVLRDSFHAHATSTRHKMAWARMLVRRLWNRGGNLRQRIRLLPNIVSDERLLSLVSRADVVLDTFPFGGSLYAHGLTLSVGTPIVTMHPGTALSTPREDLQEIRARVVQHGSTVGGTGSSGYSVSAGAHNTSATVLPSNRMANVVLAATMQADVPWVPTVGALGAYYTRVGGESLTNLLVANSTSEYAKLAAGLCSDSELSYDVRVKLLDALDTTAQAHWKDAGSGAGEGEGGGMRNTMRDSSSKNGNPDKNADMADIENAILRLAHPWLKIRLKRALETAPKAGKGGTEGSPTERPRMPLNSPKKTAKTPRDVREQMGGTIQEHSSGGGVGAPEDSEEVRKRSVTTI